ncbi:hypothetical protein ABWH97_00005 [Nitratireductor sp. ac15]
MPYISARARKALDVLADGGQFVHRLERNAYTGRDQFAYRLLKGGSVHKGFGLSVFYELRNKGFLTLAGGSTSVSTYYKLNTEAA